jgi:predicted metal-dependent hydrolase
MQKDKGILEYGELKIPYVIDYGKRKNIYISIKNNQVTIKVPSHTNRKVIEDIIQRKGSWIVEKFQEQGKVIKKTYEYKNGEIFKILGNEFKLKIEFHSSMRAKVYRTEEDLIVVLPNIYKENPFRERVQHELDKYFVKLATEVIHERLKELSSITALYPQKITIKKLTRSWGRCSSSGNISLNKDLIFYERKVIDYVILHELCHLKHMNHSKEFWELVKHFMPDYKEQEKILNNKENL